MSSVSLKRQSRNSSIELLKVFAIALVVISHVVQTLHSSNNFVGVQDYVLDISTATTNIQYLILAILRSSGAFGNTIFFVCSAWFLLDSNKTNKKKMLQILLDIWAVSVIILVVVYFLRDGDISKKMILKQIFPTFYENNWYMTCYLLFYPIHPFLNWIINKMEQRTLLRASLIMSILYIGINFLHDGHFFVSSLILWVTIYLLMGYIKFYLVGISNSTKINLAILGAGFLGNCGMVLLTNFLDLRFESFNYSLIKWATNYNPFVIMMAVALLNIARNIHFDNRAINYMSKLSLLIYIIHENKLLRLYYRPLLWQWVYTNMGYKYILLWTFALALVVFAFGFITSATYSLTVQRLVAKFVDLIYPLLSKWYAKVEKLLLKLH